MMREEREFWLLMRRQFKGLANAASLWYRVDPSPANQRFTGAIRVAFDGIIEAIDERCQVGSHEPQERSIR